MTRYQPRKEKAIALIMAVAIMAVLAVVGFGFASSMKLEHTATQALSNLSQARMGAHAALQLFAGALSQDVSSECSETAGPAADHADEACFNQGTEKTLVTWGNLTILTGLSTTPVDEASKMNLNAFGNLSKWDYSAILSDGDSLPGTNTAVHQLYHGVNERFSSFEVSFEEFFYQLHLRSNLWPGVASDVDARIRAANLARAICLYRYGGKKDGDASGDPGHGEPDYEGDGKPGAAGVDDDKDGDYEDVAESVDEDKDGVKNDPDEIGFGLLTDGIDNDGDARKNDNTIDATKVDEPYEGTDEPDEFNPYDPDRDGRTLTITGSVDDRAFDKIEDFKAAISRQHKITGSHEGTTYTNFLVPAGVDYAGSLDTSAAALEAFDNEAERLYNIVKDQLTVHSYSLNARSVSVDDPGYDGYDNDGDGKVDESETDSADYATNGIPARTVADIKTQLGTRSIYRVNLNEKKMTKAAQAAYIYWKLANKVTYVLADGSTEERQLVKGFTVQSAVDMVDYRDTDCVPTRIAANALNTTATPGQPTEDTAGFDSLHITEVGRYMGTPILSTSSVSNTADWAWNTGTGTATTATNAATDLILKFTDLKIGKYLLKFKINYLAGDLTFKDSANENPKTATAVTPASTWFFYGPLIVSTANEAVIKIAPGAAGFHSLSDFQVILPYIEITNYSRQWHDMTQYKLQVGVSGLHLPTAPIPTETTVEINDVAGSSIVVPGSAANGTPPTGQEYKAKFIPPISPGHGFDAANRHGPYYGYFVIVYDQTAFTNNFSMGTVDFPTCVMPGLFGYGSSGHGFDGKQDVRLLDDDDNLVAGGELDGFADASAAKPGVGQCAPFSSSTPAASRLISSGPLKYTTGANTVQDAYRIRPENPASPGRWNRNDGQYSATSILPPRLAWPATAAEFLETGQPNLVVLSDSGYYHSPGNVGDLPSPLLWATALSFCADYGTNDGTRQPLFKELLAFVVAARTPARLNVNTASESALRAAMVGMLPDYTTLDTARPFFSIEDIGLDGFSTTQYINDGLDSNRDNVASDHNEREEWYKRYGNTLTLRSHCFTATVLCRIMPPTGEPLAKYELQAACDRGRSVDSDGRPIVQVTSIRPGPGN